MLNFDTCLKHSDLSMGIIKRICRLPLLCFSNPCKFAIKNPPRSIMRCSSAPEVWLVDSLVMDFQCSVTAHRVASFGGAVTAFQPVSTEFCGYYPNRNENCVSIGPPLEDDSISSLQS